MSDFYQQFEKRLSRTNIIIVAVGVTGVGTMVSAFAALSLAVGGAISYLNFHWLKQAIDHLVLSRGAGATRLRVLLQYVARHALIALALFATIRFAILDLTFLLAGLFSYFLAIFLECIFEITRVLLRIDPNGRT
jgi:hypothetical protein